MLDLQNQSHCELAGFFRVTTINIIQNYANKLQETSKNIFPNSIPDQLQVRLLQSNQMIYISYCTKILTVNLSEPHEGNYIEKRITLKSNRVFLLKFIEFHNGCFVSLSEDLCKIGGVHVSVASNNRTQSARVIPNIRDPVFIKTLSEKISLMINGIVITNFNNKNPMSLPEMQEIMNEVLKLLEVKTSD